MLLLKKELTVVNMTVGEREVEVLKLSKAENGWLYECDNSLCAI